MICYVHEVLFGLKIFLLLSAFLTTCKGYTPMLMHCKQLCCTLCSVYDK